MTGHAPSLAHSEVSEDAEGKLDHHGRRPVAGPGHGGGKRLSRSAELPVRHPRMHGFFEASCDRSPEAIAVECDGRRVTYQELDRSANRLAHHLVSMGIGRGSRVGILLRRSVEMYVTLLGVLKAGAAFVPIDPGAPADRVDYIAGDSALDLLVTVGDLREVTTGLACRVAALDGLAQAVADEPGTRLPSGEEDDPAAYIIYTSGSSGRPKGVEVAQSSICNFLEIVPALYGVRSGDRVYQGMTIAFDFSIEEIWPTLAVGATVVAGPNDEERRVGPELAQFLADARITYLYCVPTVLATIDRDLPLIHTVNVGGEACQAELVERWATPRRRMLNTYGPTETTVTATCAELQPGRQVTIGRPLPTYEALILDESRHVVPDGEVGELCIGGPGVARGYVGRPDLTADRFIPHPRPGGSGRIYRTGDLARLLPNGEIEYLGRADSEVKVRGHRVDLQEIENVLLEDGEVAGAVVTLVSVGATKELAAYVTRHSPSADGETLAALSRRLADNSRRRLPAYMVPRYLDVLPTLPMLPSGKADRKSLPAPSGYLLAAGGADHVAATTAVEQQIADVWGRVFGIPASAVSAEADFFLELGGHSLLAATAVSELRRTEIGQHLAIRDLYAHPTVRALARRCEEAASTERAGSLPEPRSPGRQHSGLRVKRAGLAQVGVLYLLALVFALPVATVYSRHDGRVSLDMLVELALATAVTYLFGRWLLAPLAARLLAARIPPGRYPLWGATYLRLWVAQRLLALGPGPVLSGSPFLPAYLRLCGARVGKRCHLATSDFPLPGRTRIGSDVSIGYGARTQPFVVEDGWVTVREVTIDNGAFVGANALLLAGASVGRNASIGEHSLVAQRQAIPPGEHWTGSPSSRAEQPDATLARMRRLPAGPDTWTGKLLAGFVGGIALLELAPFLFMLPAVALVWWILLSHGVVAGLVATLFAGPLWVLTSCLTVACSKELVMPHTVSGIHPVRSGFGLRKWLTDKLLEMSLAVTNALYATLYAVPWLRALGARVGGWAEVSTAAQLDPNLLVLDEGSFIADMASVGSAAYYKGYVACGYTVVGRRSFVGNASFVRSGARLGDRSLVGVHTVSPTDGVPADSSWLGSPAIYLPRRQQSEAFDDELTFRPSRRRVIERLAIEFLRITLPPTLLAVAMYLGLLATSLLARSTGPRVVVAAVPLVVLLSGFGVVVTVAAVKWVTVGRYVPRVAPLWDRFVRRSEFVTGLYEAAAVPALLVLLTGTPLLGPLLRLFGAHVGKRTWLDTTYLTEFDLVTIGDDAAVGTNSSLQTHLFEDRVMKMSRVTIARGANVGTRAVVLYDSVVGSETSLDGLSLVMKGEHLNGANQWRGIPAQAVA